MMARRRGPAIGWVKSGPNQWRAARPLRYDACT